MPQRLREPSWAYTAWVATVLVLLVTPLWALLLVVPEGRFAHRLVRRCARWVVWCAGCRVRVTGVDRAAEHHPVMFVANHASLADAAVLLAALPAEFSFVANHLYAGYPVLGLVVRRASHHIVNRESWRGRAECAQAMAEGLRQGRSLLVFPEGRTGGDEMRPFRNGAFRAAASAGCPIVPVAIHGTGQMFPASYRLRRGHVEIEVLLPIHPDGPTRESITRARDLAAARIAEALQ